MLLVYLQIRERFKGKMNIVFPSSIKNNTTSKSSQVNPSEVEDVWAVEVQSCAEFELNWIQPTGNDSQLLGTITKLTAISRLRSV